MGLVKILVLTLFGLALWPAASPAEAADARVNVGTALRVGDRKHERDDQRGRGHVRHGHHHQHQPAVVVVTPRRCWQAGYWTYQWMPQSYSYITWVAGQWSPDGRWIDGHYAPALYYSGFYQPLWVEGYWTGC
ncbi:MAG TPA: hypothetical protein VFV05_16620 [Methylomirabilota bacterium]|nr:hypothetical protein [Methylomirabilota bacterium]